MIVSRRSNIWFLFADEDFLRNVSICHPFSFLSSSLLIIFYVDSLSDNSRVCCLTFINRLFTNSSPINIPMFTWLSRTDKPPSYALYLPWLNFSQEQIFHYNFSLPLPFSLSPPLLSHILSRSTLSCKYLHPLSLSSLSWLSFTLLSDSNEEHVAKDINRWDSAQQYKTILSPQPFFL